MEAACVAREWEGGRGMEKKQNHSQVFLRDREEMRVLLFGGSPASANKQAHTEHGVAGTAKSGSAQQ